ncbi:hypothetical protein SAMN05216553_117164 [Lentzea fradiae]|uniref:Uncharacterized protein n=1 Tax=Lentzea fradiae TaxID=200378 RepID=A0A1G8AFL6_9PSEU|nr:hypothetical protein [Lentzea fradiae]SDH19752.1 hypothetical protein SAMN05216553_117164 [Lentzea fradiae]
MTGKQDQGTGSRLVPPSDRQVVDEWLARITAVVGEGAAEDSPEACRTAAEAAEELSAYLWMLRASRRRTA